MENLVKAIKANDSSAVSDLIASGADLEERDNLGWTALFFAAYYCPDCEILDLLVKAGADIDAKDNDGDFPLVMALLSSKNPLLKLEWLLKQGADIRASNDDWQDIFGINRYYLKDNEESSKFLEPYKNKTPLMYAVEEGDLAKVKDLIPKSEIDAVNVYGKTALLTAINHRELKIAKVLIKAGANVNLADNGGVSPLTSMVYHLDNLKMVKFLIRAGADLNHQENDGYTALLYAAENQGKEKNKIIKFLLKSGANGKLADNSNWTILMGASFGTRDKKILKSLIKTGVDINAEEEIYAWTAIKKAIDCNNVELVKLLIKAGVDLKTKGLDKKNALEFARKHGSKEICQILGVKPKKRKKKEKNSLYRKIRPQYGLM